MILSCVATASRRSVSITPEIGHLGNLRIPREQLTLRCSDAAIILHKLEAGRSASYVELFPPPGRSSRNIYREKVTGNPAQPPRASADAPNSLPDVVVTVTRLDRLARRRVAPSEK
jgi:hypothetical protein